jgi:hypothetical protein
MGIFIKQCILVINGVSHDHNQSSMNGRRNNAIWAAAQLARAVKHKFTDFIMPLLRVLIPQVGDRNETSKPCHRSLSIASYPSFLFKI